MRAFREIDGLTSRAASRGRLLVAALLTVGVVPAGAVERGAVHLLFNPQAPREEWQRRPLPGAFVALSWTILIPGPGHAVDKCLYSELAQTDSHGEYVMEGPNPLTGALADAAYFAYSPGLEPVAFPYPGSRVTPKDITMTFSTRSAEERLAQLALSATPGCFQQKLADPRGLLAPYLRALLDEARGLASRSPTGRADVEHLEAALRRVTDPGGPKVLRVVPLEGGIEARGVQR